MAEVSLRNYQKQVEAYLRNERLEEAVAHSSHILGQFPKNAAAYRVLGVALLRQRRYEEAEEIFRRLLGVYPNDYEANANLSQVYEKLGQGDFSLWYAERALDQRPNERQANERLRTLVHELQGVRLERIQLTAGAVANQFLKANRTPQAIELLQAALAESAERADLRLLMAQAYWNGGEVVAAAETALEVLQTLPYAIEANTILVQLWLTEGRPSDAQRYLSRIEAVAPYEALELATGNTPPEDAYKLEELNFARYAASVDVDSPDWLESLEEDDFQTSSAQPPLEVDETPEAETFNLDDFLANSDEDDEPIVSETSTGLTDLLGDLDDELATSEEEGEVSDLFAGLDDLDDELTESEQPRQRTGLTGLLNLPDEEEEQRDEDLSLDDLFASIDAEESDFFGEEDTPDADGTMLFDDLPDEDNFYAALEADTPPATGAGGTMLFDDLPDEDEFLGKMVEDDTRPKRPAEPAAPTDAFDVPEEAAPEMPSTTDFFGDLPDDWEPQVDDEIVARFVDEPSVDSENIPTEQLADANEWLMQSSEEEPPDDSPDPLAWMNNVGIEYDEAAPSRTVLFDDDETTAVESESSDPLAWMDDVGIEYEGGDSNKFDIPDEIRQSVEAQPDDTMEFDDPQGPPPPAEMLYSPADDSAEDDWLVDDDILDEMLNLEALTDESSAQPEASDDLFAGMDWQEPMNEQPDWNENDDFNSDDDLDWLNEESFQDEPQPGDDAPDDPMAWLSEAGGETADEEEELVDPLAWMNEVGIELDDAAPEPGFDPQTSVTDHFAQGDDYEQQQMGATDFLTDNEESAPSTGLTGMLNRFEEGDVEPQAAADEPALEEESLDWLASLDADQPESAELDWMSEEPVSDPSDKDILGPGFTDRFEELEEEPDAPWSPASEGFTEEMDAAELDWLESQPDAAAEGDPWADLSMEEAPAAEPPAEPVADSTDWLEAFQEEDSEELDWLSELDTPQDEPEEEAPMEPMVAEEDPFGFAEMDLNQPEAPVDANWLDDFSVGDEEQDDFFAGLEEVTEEDNALEEDFFAGLDEVSADEEEDLFGAAQEEPAAAAPTEADWLEKFTVEEGEELEEDFFAGLDEVSADEDEEEDLFGAAQEEQPAAAAPTEADWLEEFTVEEGEELEEDFFAGLDEVSEDEEEDLFGTYGEQAAEPAPVNTEDLNWFDTTEPEEQEPEPLPFEEEPAAAPAEESFLWEEDVPQREPTGMTDFLQAIRDEDASTSEPTMMPDEPEEDFFAPLAEDTPPLDEEEIDWDDLQEEQDFAAEEDLAQPADAAWLDDFDEEEDFVEPAAASLDEVDEEYFDEGIYDDDAEYEEELDFAPTENVPDWLNAMVPGLDIDYGAEEDAPLEDRYEEGASHRNRALTENEQIASSTGDFGWLQDIVDKEINAGEGEERSADGSRRRQRFIFSRLPRWLVRPRRDAQAVAEPPPAVVEDDEALDDLPDFDLDEFDDLDEDFEFDDFQ